MSFRCLNEKEKRWDAYSAAGGEMTFEDESGKLKKVRICYITFPTSILNEGNYWSCLECVSIINDPSKNNP